MSAIVDRIYHKVCHGLVVRVMGGRLWCEKCCDYVDAVDCYYDQGNE